MQQSAVDRHGSIVMRFAFNIRLERALSVLKARATAHNTALRRFIISSAGLKMGEGFGDLQGLLTGLPVERTTRR